MEKLIVKNFGPIKEAEIDLTKYVVFIGDTSTGKSVLAKLIAIFRDSELIYSTKRIETFKNLLVHYNIEYSFESTDIHYSSKEWNIILQENILKVFYKNETFIFGQSNGSNNIGLVGYISDIQRLLLTERDDDEKRAKLHKELDDILNSYHNNANQIPVYFPAERILISLVSNSISGLWSNNVALPECLKKFASKFEVSRQRIRGIDFIDFNFTYQFANDGDYIYYSEVELNLSQSSSGIQSLLPLLIVLEHEIKYGIDKSPKILIVEEPELNLFPVKQKKVIEYFTSRLNNSEHKLIITTHSPYILSVLDTLMLAKNTYNEHPDLKVEINAIVSEDKWIDYNDISVYEVRNDGTIKSIKNEEFKSIDTNAIDGVSDIISEEFDKLTELRYAQ